MTGTVNGAVGEFVVVHVKDAINSVLTGREDVSYQSPPLRAEEAMTLVRLLLGRGGTPQEGEVRWRCPIAGGQRTIRLEPADELEAPVRGGQPSNGALP
jgi:hypothetical protein